MHTSSYDVLITTIETKNAINKSKGWQHSRKSYLKGGVKDVMMVVYLTQHATYHWYDSVDNPLATSQAKQLETSWDSIVHANENFTNKCVDEKPFRYI